MNKDLVARYPVLYHMAERGSLHRTGARGLRAPEMADLGRPNPAFSHALQARLIPSSGTALARHARKLNIVHST